MTSDYFYSVDISMALLGQWAADEKLQLEPVVAVRREDLTK
jgi:hypothetical protein